MPLPRSVALVNRRFTNHVLGPLAAYLPGFGVVVHRGRRSGTEYRTPVNVFLRPAGAVVALTYGPNSDWVRNVLASGGCTIYTRGRRLRFGDARLIHDATRRGVPPVVRHMIRLGGVADFLELTLVTTVGSAVPGWVPPFNAVARRLLAAGMPMGPNGLIRVRGRKSGLWRTTPITLIESSGQCWVIGVYGEVDWVRNLRAAGHADILMRGRRRSVIARELSHAEAVEFFETVFAPLVRRYGGLGAWIVRHLDKIDISDPRGAAAGRPVFELRDARG